MNKDTTVLISSYSRSPSDTAAHKQYDIMGLVLLVDTQTATILAAEATWSTNLGRQFINDVLEGKSILDVDSLTHIIQNRYFGRVKKAIISALVSCCTIYAEHFTGTPPSEKTSEKSEKQVKS